MDALNLDFSFYGWSLWADFVAKGQNNGDGLGSSGA